MDDSLDFVATHIVQKLLITSLDGFLGPLFNASEKRTLMIDGDQMYLWHKQEIA